MIQTIFKFGQDSTILRTKIRPRVQIGPESKSGISPITVRLINPPSPDLIVHQDPTLWSPVTSGERRVARLAILLLKRCRVARLAILLLKRCLGKPWRHLVKKHVSEVQSKAFFEGDASMYWTPWSLIHMAHFC